MRCVLGGVFFFLLGVFAFERDESKRVFLCENDVVVNTLAIRSRVCLHACQWLGHFWFFHRRIRTCIVDGNANARFSLKEFN